MIEVTMTNTESQITLDRLLEDDNARVLVRGATVLSMDDGVGDFARGDILVQGSTIEAVGADLADAASDGQELVVDASRHIAIPGLQDGHRHCWQSQFRRLIPDVDLMAYIELMHLRLGPEYEAEDMYVGTLLAALAALDAGVTTVLDVSHNTRSPEHADAVIRAWKDSGARAVVAPIGPASPATWGASWRDDLARVRAEHCPSDDALVTMRLGAYTRIGPIVTDDLALTRDAVDLADELGIGVTVDAVFGEVASAHLVEMHEAGVLRPGITYIHCQSLTDAAWSAIADSGGSVVLASTSDAQLRCEDSVPPIQDALDRGLRPALSVDVECCLTSDLFTQMQVTLNAQRMLSGRARHEGHDHVPPALSLRDVLELATVAGARANGVERHTGSLTPGKQADVVLIRNDDVNNMPFNNAVGTVVLGADARNVDAVLVGGRPRKWDGRLVGVDVEAVGRMAVASRDRLLERIGYELDVVG
jgi:cytosine/adenosine deaminase-related metal-dependent hydrolase